MKFLEESVPQNIYYHRVPFIPYRYAIVKDTNPLGGGLRPFLNRICSSSAFQPFLTSMATTKLSRFIQPGDLFYFKIYQKLVKFYYADNKTRISNYALLFIVASALYENILFIIEYKFAQYFKIKRSNIYVSLRISKLG
jgi:hypothetical protein